MLLCAAGLFVLFAQPAGASAYKVLFANAVGGCEGNTTVQTQLAALPGVAKVDAFNASAGTPSVAQLDAYDMVVTHSDCDAYADGTAIGNNLADYADHRGVVVEYAYAMHTNTDYSLGGRWASGGYSPYLPGTNVNNSVTLGVSVVGSPLMTGVNNLTSECNTDPTLAPGANRVAVWTNGQEAIAQKGQAVAVTASIDDTCPSGGDYAQLTLNAVKTLQKPPSGTLISKKKVNKKKHTAKFEFSAGLHVDGFECALGRAKKGKKNPKLSFRACSSPKKYKHLKSGKYTFEARAVNSAGPDPVPAVKKFKI